MVVVNRDRIYLWVADYNVSFCGFEIKFALTCYEANLYNVLKVEGREVGQKLRSKSSISKLHMADLIKNELSRVCLAACTINSYVHLLRNSLLQHS